VVLIPQRRLLERRVRWISFLIFGSVWIIVTEPFGLLPQIAGFVFLAVLLLQVWTGTRIPVLTYHSVSEDGSWLNKPGLVVPVASFKRQIRWLARHRYTTLTMDELQARRTQCINRRKIITLTFDDGYLDSWVAVEPLLREHKMRGTVFVSTAWIDEEKQCRPKLDNSPTQPLTWSGYLNAGEIRALSDGGVLDIQSHAVSHDTIFCNDQIAAFATPGPQPQWLTALLNSSHKPTWYRLEKPVPAGYPLFSTGEALAVAAFHPDPELIKEMTATAADTSFFTDTNWQQTLYDIANRFRSNHGKLGQMETGAETRQRWRLELEESKRVLSEITGREIEHLCWPRDASCPETKELAFSLGYKSVTGGSGTNRRHNPHLVSRLYVEACGVGWLDLTAFVLQIWLFEGRIWAWPLLILAARSIQFIRYLNR